MSLTPNETTFILWVGGLLAVVLLRILHVIGNKMVSKLENIAVSVEKIDKKLGVLANDHSNLKEDHNELKERVKALENA